MSRRDSDSEKVPAALYDRLTDTPTYAARMYKVQVRNEIKRHTPGLLDWLDVSSTDTRLSLVELDGNTADALQHHIRRIATGWPHWRPVRTGNSADPWVIAYARALGSFMVSEERPRMDGRGSVKIPRICTELG